MSGTAGNVETPHGGKETFRKSKNTLGGARATKQPPDPAWRRGPKSSDRGNNCALTEEGWTEPRLKQETCVISVTF